MPEQRAAGLCSGHVPVAETGRRPDRHSEAVTRSGTSLGVAMISGPAGLRCRETQSDGGWRVRCPISAYIHRDLGGPMPFTQRGGSGAQRQPCMPVPGGFPSLRMRNRDLHGDLPARRLVPATYRGGRGPPVRRAFLACVLPTGFAVKIPTFSCIGGAETQDPA